MSQAWHYEEKIICLPLNASGQFRCRSCCLYCFEMTELTVYRPSVVRSILICGFLSVRSCFLKDPLHNSDLLLWHPHFGITAPLCLFIWSLLSLVLLKHLLKFVSHVRFSTTCFRVVLQPAQDYWMTKSPQKPLNPCIMFQLDRKMNAFHPLAWKLIS